MIAIIWSPQSLRDLEGIRAYIAQDSPRYAELVVQRIVAAVDRLEAFPESGRVAPEPFVTPVAGDTVGAAEQTDAAVRAPS